MSAAFTMITGSLKMQIEFLPCVCDGQHRSTVSFEMWDAEIGECQAFPISEEGGADEPEKA